MMIWSDIESSFSNRFRSIEQTRCFCSRTLLQVIARSYSGAATRSQALTRADNVAEVILSLNTACNRSWDTCTPRGDRGSVQLLLDRDGHQESRSAVASGLFMWQFKSDLGWGKRSMTARLTLDRFSAHPLSGKSIILFVSSKRSFEVVWFSSARHCGQDRSCKWRQAVRRPKRMIRRFGVLRGGNDLSRPRS